jgi:uncharacterized peroxidase-related enzyme
MAVLKEIDPKHATGRTKELFDGLDRPLGRVPTMVRLMANSPAILDTYLHFSHALEETTLSPRVRALITVAIAEINGCDYTLSLGMALAKRQGVSDEDLQLARFGRAHDLKTADALCFATSIASRGGRVPRADVERLRRDGFSDAEIVDIVAAVAFNIFRNYFNLLLDPDIDSPVVRTSQTTQML